MPTARYVLGVAAVDGKIYAIGGIAGSIHYGTFLQTVEEYNPATDSWTTKAPMPTARYYVAIAAVGGKLYAIGGSNGSSLSTVEQYDPVANTWAGKTSMPTARHGHAVAVVGGKIYAIEGHNGVNFLNTVDEYTPNSTAYILFKN